MPYSYLPESSGDSGAGGGSAPVVVKKPADGMSFFDKLILLVVVWKYFHFTGKAIAEGKKIPKDWLKMRDRILPKKIKEMLSDTPKPVKPPSYKVVDLATKEPITVQ